MGAGTVVIAVVMTLIGGGLGAALVEIINISI